MEITGAEVLSHEDEAPLIKEATRVEVKGLKHREVLDYCGGIEVIHVPGHSEGNACYYLPAVKAEWLRPDYAGIRPRLAGPGETFRDFVVAEESEAGYPGFVNLIGIESPGLTAAPAIRCQSG